MGLGVAEAARRRELWPDPGKAPRDVRRVLIYRLDTVEPSWRWECPLSVVGRAVEHGLGSHSDPMSRPVFVEGVLAKIGLRGTGGREESATESLARLAAGTEQAVRRFDRSVGEVEAPGEPGAKGKGRGPEALAHTAADSVQMIVLPSLAHLSTVPARLGRALAAIAGAGVHLWFVEDDIDTRYPTGRAAVVALIRAAHHVQKANSRRTRSAQRAKRERGELYARRPWGTIEKEGRLSVDPIDEPIIREIQRRRQGGESPQAIRATLNREGRLRRLLGGALAADGSPRHRLWRTHDIEEILEREDLYGSGAKA